MTSLRDLRKMREILKTIEQGKGRFGTAYSLLDQMEGKLRSNDDQQEQLIEECIRPIQTLMQSNRHSLMKLKENGESLMNTLKENSARKVSQKTYTNEELDSEINYLTSVLKSKKMIR